MPIHTRRFFGRVSVPSSEPLRVFIMKLKVLHVIDSEGIYGAETMLLGLMVEQQRMGTKPILCRIGRRGGPEKAIEAEAATKGIAVARIRMSGGPNPFGAFKILRVAAEGRVDLIHSHGYKGNILLAALAQGDSKGSARIDFSWLV